MMIIDTLRCAEIFKSLSEEQLEKLSNNCVGATYQQGSSIFREGDEATHVYILTHGTVMLEIAIRPVPDGPDIPTAVEVVSPGDCFGWSALIEPHVYTSSAVCRTICGVLGLNGDLLRKLMADDPQLGYALMRGAAKLVALRLMNTRLRLITGLGLIVPWKPHHTVSELP